MPDTLTIEPSGPFSLAETIAFGFGQRDARAGDTVLRLAFCLDGYQQHAGVVVRQDEAACTARRCGFRRRARCGQLAVSARSG